MILPWTVGLALLGAAVVATRWATRRTDVLGRRRAFPYGSVIALLVVAAIAAVPWILRVWLENELGAAATRFVGASATVHCQTFGEAFVDAGAELGYVAFRPDGVPEHHTLIKRRQCSDLASYLHSDMSNPTMEQVVAVHTLTHEAVHMSGETDEAKTECFAVQRDAEMARLLGAPDAGAARLADDYWISIYPRMPDPYRSSQCTPGGPLDVHSPFSPWRP
ncbi:MAG TPA: hypothetical protein VFK89_12840 [Actinomycetota bacterium]|nr:hypothetical protein [Actinomycetota bacterium]